MIGDNERQLSAAEQELGLRLPDALRMLYLTSNGIYDRSGQWWVVWPLDRLVSDSLSAWQEGRLPTALIAFGDDGIGNPFCLRATDDAGSLVFRWSWIDNQAEQDEGTMAEFLAEWCPR